MNKGKDGTQGSGDCDNVQLTLWEILLQRRMKNRAVYLGKHVVQSTVFRIAEHEWNWESEIWQDINNSFGVTNYL